MAEQVTDVDRSGSTASDIDHEPGYLLSAAPDPRRIDPLDNPRLTEDGCFAITAEKKYYEFEAPTGAGRGGVFIKRNLTPSEYIVNRFGDLVLPYMCLERLKNEVAAIRYIQRHTAVPTPHIRAAFEDHGRYYIITDLVPGVPLQDIPDEKKAVVWKELEGYIAQMHAITSDVIGGFAGDVVVPYRVGRAIARRDDQALKLRPAPTREFVLCHNDLSQSNVIVDETTLKINAIIDWEYAGFFPVEFDGAFYLRRGASAALEGEVDDVPKLLELLEHWKA